MVGRVKLRLTVRDLESSDLTHLDWSGGSQHVRAMAEALQASWGGDLAALVIALPNERLAAVGVVDFRPEPGAGVLSKLAVHEHLQSLGLGTRLVAALERRVRRHGLTLARLTVEHDNPRALALYRRLGYREVGSRLETWPVAGERSYVTVSRVLEHDLTEA